MKKYNILYIEDTIGLGGSLVSLCNLIQELDVNKYHAFSVLYYNNQDEYHKSRCKRTQTVIAKPREVLKSSYIGSLFLRVTALFGTQAARLGAFLLFIGDFVTGILPYAVKLYFKVRSWDIDLIHLNTGVCIPGIVLAKLLRVPCISTQRGPEWKSPVIAAFSKYIDFFMANSGATREGLIAMGVDPSRITVVYPPVNLKYFDFTINSDKQRKEFNIKNNNHLFGILGNLGEGKGHKVVLKAGAKVFQKYPESKLLIIGDSPDGSSDFKDELISLSDKLNIASNVIFTGFRKDIPELIQILDVVIHASLFPEPFGKVIIEGMAMKKPVIATLGGGTSEIIDDGINGYLVLPNDHKHLADKIISLLDNKILRMKIGDAALQKVQKHFEIEQHTRKTENKYKAVLHI